jgi:NADH-quinone oxidoreductase subunit A
VPEINAYLPIAVLLILGAGMALALSFASALVGPHNPTRAKQEPFECGSLPARGSAQDRFGVKFYVVALLFIVFDVEAVFLYPWAVLLRELAWPGLISMAVFVATVVLGLIYVWKKGALDWEH